MALTMQEECTESTSMIASLVCISAAAAVTLGPQHLFLLYKLMVVQPHSQHQDQCGHHQRMDLWVVAPRVAESNVAVTVRTATTTVTMAAAATATVMTVAATAKEWAFV